MQRVPRVSKLTAGGRFARSRGPFGLALYLLATPAGAQVRPGPAPPVRVVRAPLSPTSPAEAFAPCAAAGAFRFAATVLRRDSITTRMIRNSSLNAVVRVDTVLSAPRSVRPLGGRVITVILSDTSDTSAVGPGNRSLYLASGVLFDTSVVLRAHCHVVLNPPQRVGSPRPTSVTTLIPVLAKADSLNDRAALLARTQDAAVVAAVRVTAIDSSLQFSYPGEHNPRWRTAITTVRGRFKPGQDAPNVGDTLRFFFPGTDDFMYGGLRVRQTDEVLVLLHRLSVLSPPLRLGLDSTQLVLFSRSELRPAGDSVLVKVP